MKLMDVKLPDLADFHFNASMSTKECQAECFKKCDCMAYANSNVSGEGSSNGGTGCLLWYGDLIDIKGFTEESRRQDVYIRLAASELGMCCSFFHQSNFFPIFNLIISSTKAKQVQLHGIQIC